MESGGEQHALPLDIGRTRLHISFEAQWILPSFRGPRESAGFRAFWGCGVTYIAYLDEFGHIGPYISRTDPKHNDSPVFGLAGFVLPIDEVRNFGTWFYKRKCELLSFEIDRSGSHPATWEKKGASLYTARNVEKYAELRKFTFRLFNKIDSLGGFVFYVGGSNQTRQTHIIQIISMAMCCVKRSNASISIVRKTVCQLKNLCLLSTSMISDRH